MTDTNKGKVASLTGSLLARKGTATPAGFTRVHAGEIDPSAPAPPIEADATPDGVASDQPSLSLSGGSGEGKDGGAEEGWAPLSQIVIRPHPFISKEPPPEPVPDPVPEAPPALAPIGDIGIEPALLMSPALMLPVTSQENARRERVTVETPVVAPVLQHNEPILVVPRLQRDVGEGFDGGASADVEKNEYEELPAPTLGPAMRDRGPDREVPEGVAVRLDPVLEPGARPATEPQLGESTQSIAPTLGVPSVKGNEKRGRPEPIVLPRPAPVLAPVVAKRSTSRAKVATANVMPPIRIGELQARARVIPTRTRRRRRIGPVIFALLALAVFLGVTWQAYRTSRDNEGAVAAVGPDGEPTIWATVDELGYAVSQIFAAIAGRRGPDGEEGRRLAGGGAENTPPPATFVPAGPIGTLEQSTGRGVAGAAPLPGDIDDGLVETEAVEAKAEPGPEPVVAVARPASQVRLPAPPVPVAPVVRVDTIAAAPQPVGVSAPPPPPLNLDDGVDRGFDSATAPPGLEEVDTAVALEPLAPAAVAVAAGVGSGDIAEDSGTAVPAPDVEAVAGAAVGEGLAPVAPAPNAATQIAALPAEGGPAGGLDNIVLEGAGVPVLKPAVRSQQQSLGGAGGPEVSGPDASGTENGRSSDVDGYAVQLSSLRTRAQAEREHERLRGDYPALLGEVELLVSEGLVSNRGTFFRILTSRFEDAGAAQVLCRSLRDRGQDCLVVRR